MTQFSCSYDCPTPYPHSLTSISLLVSPQQIRKASQHLHGDRPQLSRWPQCAARQLKRERQAGKRKWVRIRGSRASNVKLSLPWACTQTYVYVHAQTFMPQCTPSLVSPAETNTHPMLVSECQHWEWKEGSERLRKCRTGRAEQTAPESHTPNLSSSGRPEKLPPELHGQIPPPNQ